MAGEETFWCRTKRAPRSSGALFDFRFLVDLAGGLSKLTPAVTRLADLCRSIRHRSKTVDKSKASIARRRVRLAEDALAAAARQYEAGVTLRELAGELGVSRPRLSALLRARGVRIRGASPSGVQIAEMKRLYTDGASLEVVGSRLGFSAGTVRSWLIIEGVTMRDTHGRER